MAGSRLREVCWCGACRAEARGIPYREWLDHHLLEMHEKIRRHGYTFTAVEGSGRPTWVYSVGLIDRFAHPELTVVGLCANDAFAVLTAWAEVIRAGVHPRRGREADARADVPSKFVDVHPHHCKPIANWFAMWHEYHRFLGCGPSPLTVLQLVYPDKQGRFPDDDGCDQELSRHQWLLDQ